MSKKKKKKLADRTIKILENGKIKIVDDTEIDIRPFISESIRGAFVQRSSSIITKEAVDAKNEEGENPGPDFIFYDGEPLGILNVKHNLIREYGIISNPTVIFVVDKTNATDIFDFVTDSCIGTLLRTTTFAAVYSKSLKKSWEKLTSDRTSSSVTMYVPNVLQFLSHKNGKILEDPKKFDLVFIAEPNRKQLCYSEDGSKIQGMMDKHEAVKIIGDDIIETIIRLGAENPIINFEESKLLTKNSDELVDKIFMAGDNARFAANAKLCVVETR